MESVLIVFLCSLIGGIISLIGGILLLANKKRDKLSEYATSFAAGALLAAAFIDIIPRIMESTEPHAISYFILIGLLIFFIFESLVKWFHHHHPGDEKRQIDSVVPMVIIGGGIHNFIDGIAIAAGFLVSVETGIIVTFAVAVHEVPQKLGNLGLLFHKGLKRGKALLINALSALVTVISATIFYVIGEVVEVSFMPLLAIMAGFFIYIAASDLIPNIHHEKNRKKVILQTLILLLGVAVVWIIIVSMHGLID